MTTPFGGYGGDGLPLLFPLSFPFPFIDGAAFDELLLPEVEDLEEDLDDDREVEERDVLDPERDPLLDFDERESLDELL